MSLLYFCDIVILVYDGGFMKKKNILLYLFTLCLVNMPSIVYAYGRVTEQQIKEERTGFIAMLLYFSPILIIALISLFLYFLNIVQNSYALSAPELYNAITPPEI